jgi:hypothetical protein
LAFSLLVLIKQNLRIETVGYSMAKLFEFMVAKLKVQQDFGAETDSHKVFYIFTCKNIPSHFLNRLLVQSARNLIVKPEVKTGRK